MKNTILIAALVTLPLSLPSWAEETHHTDKDKRSSTAMDGGSAGNAGSNSRPKNMTDKNNPMQMDKMQESMLRMHEQMHKITAASNPQERERLTQEHSRMMQENMAMMGMNHGTDNYAKGSKTDGTHKIKSTEIDSVDKTKSTGKSDPNTSMNQGSGGMNGGSKM